MRRKDLDELEAQIEEFITNAKNLEWEGMSAEEFAWHRRMLQQHEHVRRELALFKRHLVECDDANCAEAEQRLRRELDEHERISRSCIEHINYESQRIRNIQRRQVDMMGQLTQIISKNAAEFERSKDPVDAVVSLIKGDQGLSEELKIELAVFWRHTAQQKQSRKEAESLVRNWWRKR